MARRITAALAIVFIVGVILLLVWTVERHRERAVQPEEPASVAFEHRSASSLRSYLCNCLRPRTASFWHGCCSTMARNANKVMTPTIASHPLPTPAPPLPP